MEMVIILARRDFLKKGNRVVVKISKDYYNTGIITSIRTGNVYVKTDDDNKFTFKEGSKSIIGEANNKIASRSFSPNELNTYLKNPIISNEDNTSEDTTYTARKLPTHAVKVIRRRPLSRTGNKYGRGSKPVPDSSEDTPTNNPLNDLVSGNNNISTNTQAQRTPIFKIIYKYKNNLDTIRDGSIVRDGFSYKVIKIPVINGDLLNKELTPHVERKVNESLGSYALFFKDGSAIYASPINSLYKNSQDINYISPNDFENRESVKSAKQRRVAVRPIVLNIEHILESVTENVLPDLSEKSLWSNDKMRWVDLKATTFEISNMKRAIELIQPHVDHVITLTPQRARGDDGYNKYFALKNGGIINAYPINKPQGWMFYITPKEAEKFFK